MTAFLEARLARQLQAAGEDALLEAVIVVQERGSAADDGGLASQLVARTAERCGEAPRAVRYFPRANAAVITASRRFLEELLLDGDIAAASSPDVETFPFTDIE